jgi:glycosyltransferase involved in cell wall biosynthesis
MIPKLVKSLRQHINEFKPDLIVSHDEVFSHIYATYLASKDKPWTCILQLPPVGLFYLEPWVREVVDQRIFIKNYLKASLMQPIIWHALNNTIPILVSKTIALEVKLLGLELKQYRSLSIPIGLNHTLIKQARKQEESYDVVFMARLVPEKGIYDLVNIWVKVTKVIRDATLCVIGKFYDQKVERRMKQLIAKYGVGNRIVFKGYLDDKEKYSVMKSSKVFLYPSRESIAMLEALACGLPAVAYKTPPIVSNFPTDAVIKVRIGDYTEAANNVIKLLTDRTLRIKLSHLATLFSSKYTWENAAKDELEAYKNVIEKLNA